MATEYHYFEGTARFYRSKTPDEYGNYSLKIKLDDVDKYKKSGIQCELDEEGGVWFRRPDQKLFKDELTKLGPPNTVDKDGSPINDLVGEGSKIIAKVKSYDTKAGRKGHQLEAVQVLDLEKVDTGSKDGWYNF